jgi:excisionase family DNA binding protein
VRGVTQFFPFPGGPPKPPISTRAAARILGVSMSTVRNLIRAGKLRASLSTMGLGTDRKHFRIMRSSVDRLLERQFPPLR